MAYELIYTSAPRGLKAGTTGFTTVAMTSGLSPVMVQKLESLTGYKQVYRQDDPQYVNNPPAFFHYYTTVAQKNVHIIGRVCSCPPDYTGRSNKLGHFLVLDDAEVAANPGGPAGWHGNASPFITSWNSQPQLISQLRQLPAAIEAKLPAQQWKALAGDAGWAGLLAQTYLNNPRQRIFVLYSPQQHSFLLELVNEALAILTPEQRWTVNYNTGTSTVPPDLLCHWNFCPVTPDGTPVLPIPNNAITISLLTPAPCTASGPCIDVARNGAPAAPAVAPAPALIAVPPQEEQPTQNLTSTGTRYKLRYSQEQLQQPPPQPQFMAVQASYAQYHYAAPVTPSIPSTPKLAIASYILNVVLLVALLALGGAFFVVAQEQKSTIATRQGKIDEQEGSINDLKAKIDELEGSINGLKATIDEQKGLIDALKDTITKHEDTIKQKDDTIAKHEGTIADLRTKLAKHEATIKTELQQNDLKTPTTPDNGNNRSIPPEDMIDFAGDNKGTTDPTHDVDGNSGELNIIATYISNADEIFNNFQDKGFNITKVKLTKAHKDLSDKTLQNRHFKDAIKIEALKKQARNIMIVINTDFMTNMKTCSKEDDKLNDEQKKKFLNSFGKCLKALKDCHKKIAEL